MNKEKIEAIEEEIEALNVAIAFFTNSIDQVKDESLKGCLIARITDYKSELELLEYLLK